MVNARRIAVATFVFLASVAWMSLGPAFAGPFEDAITALGGKSFNARMAAVEALGETGDPRAVPVLNALMDGELYTRKDDKSVVLTRPSGKVFILTDAVTGQEIGEAAKKDLTKIKVNNRMRGLIRGGVAGVPGPGTHARACDQPDDPVVRNGFRSIENGHAPVDHVEGQMLLPADCRPDDLVQDRDLFGAIQPADLEAPPSDRAGRGRNDIRTGSRSTAAGAIRALRRQRMRVVVIVIVIVGSLGRHGRASDF